jgi:aspartokinase
MERIRIEGIKLSEAFALVNLANHPRPQDALARTCGIMASNRINMPFISATCLGGRARASCCVAVEVGDQVKTLLEGDPDLRGFVEIVPSVGLLSVFPHQSSLKILGCSLSALGDAGLTVYGLASSLAPLTFVLDHAVLDEAAAALEDHLELPPNQGPIRAHVRVTQSTIRREDERPEEG